MKSTQKEVEREGMDRVEVKLIHSHRGRKDPSVKHTPLSIDSDDRRNRHICVYPINIIQPFS